MPVITVGYERNSLNGKHLTIPETIRRRREKPRFAWGNRVEPDRLIKGIPERMAV